jgi:hypothetical protein
LRERFNGIGYKNCEARRAYKREKIVAKEAANM